MCDVLDRGEFVCGADCYAGAYAILVIMLEGSEGGGGAWVMWKVGGVNDGVGACSGDNWMRREYVRTSVGYVIMLSICL